MEACWRKALLQSMLRLHLALLQSMLRFHLALLQSMLRLTLPLLSAVTAYTLLKTLRNGNHQRLENSEASGVTSAR